MSIQQSFLENLEKNQIEKKSFLFTKSYQYKPTGSIIKFHRLYFEGADLEYLSKCLSEGRIVGDRELKKSHSNAVMMEVYAATDGSFMAAQLSKYVPHAYNPIAETAYFHGEQAQQLRGLL